MKINVTWADIRDGITGKPTACMVALALKRQLGVSYASVGYRDARVVIDGEVVKIYLPRQIENKIRFWDGFHMVLPFSFELTCSGFLCGSAIAPDSKPARHSADAGLTHPEFA
jgi:hypothetical protein